MLQGKNQLVDPEFGVIKVRRTNSHYLRVRVGEDGQITASAPRFVSLRALQKLIDQSRVALRKSVASMPKRGKKLTEAQKKALKKTGEKWLKPRLAELAQQHGLEYQKVRIMNAKTRWGSYSSSGTVSLNYALMQVPETLRDYVIVHELTHSLHMNHSPAFWAKVAEFYPRAKWARKEMKKYSPYL